MPAQLHFRLALAACGLAWLAGCGQTGPLYYPDQDITTPVEIRPASAPVPMPPPEPAPAEPEEAAKKPPPEA